MLTIDFSASANQLLPAVEQLFALSARKLRSLERSWTAGNGTPVFTAKGQYISRGWTDWTQGFEIGSAILQFDATEESQFLRTARAKTVALLSRHVSNTGVHDHGFNNVSTYGNLLRLMREGRLTSNEWERNYYELALKLSGAVQAGRWTQLAAGRGYLYSFNGRHSLFSDTIRSLRALALSHQLGHCLLGEQDSVINLLHRAVQHARTTAQFNVYFGKGRDAYDIRGRVAQESIFNVNAGGYRCPSTQQGFSPFSTWTRGQAWILCGYAEQLEFLHNLHESEFEAVADKRTTLQLFEAVASAVCDFWIDRTPTDGIPYWDDGAPGLSFLGDWSGRPADPFNDYEPVDSSAAVIAAQGLIRYGNYLRGTERKKQGNRYRQAGLTIARNLFRDPYLSSNPKHQGLILHSVYHRPNGWDHIPAGRKIPCGESSMWGDYHARELALMLWREAKALPYYTFFINP